MLEVLGWAFRIADWGCLLWVGFLLARQTQVFISARTGVMSVLEANRRMIGLLGWMALFALVTVVFRAASTRLLQGI